MGLSEPLYPLHAVSNGSLFYTVNGENTGSSGAGVRGIASGSGGTAYGVFGYSNAASGTGVYGQAANSSGVTYGVYGTANSANGYGVFGNNGNANGFAGHFNGKLRSTQFAELGSSVAPYGNGGTLRGIWYMASATPESSDGHQLLPPNSFYGYLGTSTRYWYLGYASGWNIVSARESKRDLVRVEEDGLADLVMDDIDRLHPTFYKFKVETDQLEPGKEGKYRPNMHLGLILDEAPDYLKDNTLMAVDLYSVATLAVAGVKHNRAEIQELQRQLGLAGSRKVSDFGSETMSLTEMWVPFAPEFADLLNGAVPVVTVTADEPGVSLSVTKKDARGFKVVTSGTRLGFHFDWIAMARVAGKAAQEPVAASVPVSLRNQLHLPDATRATVELAQQQLQERLEHGANGS